MTDPTVSLMVLTLAMILHYSVFYKHMPQGKFGFLLRVPKYIICQKI